MRREPVRSPALFSHPTTETPLHDDGTADHRSRQRDLFSETPDQGQHTENRPTPPEQPSWQRPDLPFTATPDQPADKPANRARRAPARRDRRRIA